MGLVTAEVIFERFGFALNDELNVRWTEKEFLAWLNAAQVAVVTTRFDAFSQLIAIPLSAGTRQDVPSSTLMFLGVTQNMGSDGETQGDAILPIDLATLNQTYPGWHTATASNVVKRFAVDKKHPRIFYVFPPQPDPATQYVNINHVPVPTEIKELGDTISVDDSFQNSLLCYCLYKALSKDSEHAPTLARAKSHYEEFMLSLGVTLQGDSE